MSHTPIPIKSLVCPHCKEIGRIEELPGEGWVCRACSSDYHEHPGLHFHD